MKKILTGLMALTCILAFSLEASARGFKGQNKGKTSLELQKLENARVASQGVKSVAVQRSEAVTIAENIRKGENSTFVYNLEQIIKLNPTVRAENKINSAKVLTMIKSLNRLDSVEVVFNPKKAIETLKRDLLAEGFSKEQIRDLSKEVCRI